MCWIVALHASPSDNSIGADGAKAFAEALKVNNTLTQLHAFSMFPLLPIPGDVGLIPCLFPFTSSWPPPLSLV